MKKLCFLLFTLIILAGCKPTEKNYASAYIKASEAARLKNANIDNDIAEHQLEAIDGPRLEVNGNDSVYVAPNRVKLFESDSSPEKGKYGIAVAKYSMPTNARRHLQDIKKEYPDAFLAFDGNEGYYVMIERVPSVPEAAEPIRVFKLKHPDFRYMGLPGTPVTYFVTP